MSNFDENSIVSFLSISNKSNDLNKDEDINIQSFNPIEEFDPNLTQNKELFESIFLGSDSKSSTVETKKDKIFNIEKKNKNMLQKKRGRKKRTDKSKGNHNKNSEYNMITKIKIAIFQYAIDIINQNLPENKEIFKLEHKVIRNLQKDLNIQMFDKTLKNLFLEINKSEKFKKIEYKDNNKKIIGEIDEGIIERERVKKILNLTFFELLEIFRKKKEEILSDKRLEELNLLVGNEKEKESGYERFINKLKEEKESVNYISKIFNLIFNYKNWFESKIGRKKSNN